MNNPRITAKERNLLKGAIRRTFSRSELRRAVIDAASIEHEDPKRPRVKKWGWCNVCGEVVPRYTMAVDHIEPLIPVDTTLESMSWDEVVDRTWCERHNLQAICEPCHKAKTKAERQQRKLCKKLDTK